MIFEHIESNEFDSERNKKITNMLIGMKVYTIIVRLHEGEDEKQENSINKNILFPILLMRKKKLRIDKKNSIREVHLHIIFIVNLINLLVHF